MGYPSRASGQSGEQALAEPQVDPGEPLQGERREQEQREALLAIQSVTEAPMVALSLVMLALLIVEFTLPLSPAWSRRVTLAGWIIWAAFLGEFTVSFLIAPRKWEFLKENWIAALSLALPALRVFRVFRAVRAFRAARTFRVVAVTNRNLRKLGLLFARRKIAYLIGSAAVVIFASAAGVFLVEREAPSANIRSYADAVWWAAGAVTTAGTELYPVTSEGRFLAFLTMLFGLSVFGYVAGSLATYFLYVDALDPQAEESAPPADQDARLEELRELEARVAELRDSLRERPGTSSR